MMVYLDPIYTDFETEGQILRSWHEKCSFLGEKTIRPMLWDRCLSVLSVVSVCLSVTLVYCGQTVGWIGIPLGMVVGFVPNHIVLDGDPVGLQKAQPLPIFGPCLLWPNGWMDQYATWYGGRPRPRQQCVRWGPSSPHGKGTAASLFGPCLAKRLDGYH